MVTRWIVPLTTLFSTGMVMVEVLALEELEQLTLLRNEFLPRRENF